MVNLPPRNQGRAQDCARCRSGQDDRDHREGPIVLLAAEATRTNKHSH